MNGEDETFGVALAVCRAWTHGTVESLIRTMAPDVVLVPLPTVRGEPYVGHAGIRRLYHDAAHEWDVMRFVVHRVAVRDEQAVLLGRFQLGRDGILRDGRAAWVLEVRDGLVRRSVSHTRWDDALAAAGLTLADARPIVMQTA